MKFSTKGIILAGGVAGAAVLLFLLPMAQQESKYSGLTAQQRDNVISFEDKCSSLMATYRDSKIQETCSQAVDQAILEYRTGKVSSVIDGYQNPNGNKTGLFVLMVLPESLAESVGIDSKSVILSVAGYELKSQESIQEFGNILRQNLGSTVQLTWTDSTGLSKTDEVTFPSSVRPGESILGVIVIPMP